MSKTRFLLSFRPVPRLMMLLTLSSISWMTLNNLTSMLKELLTPRTTLMNKSELQPFLSSPKLWRWTKSSLFNHKITRLDSNKNLPIPRTISLGTILEETKSNVRLKLLKITNVTLINFSCAPSRWTKKPLKLLSSLSKTLLVTLLPDNPSNSTKCPNLKFQPLLKSSRNTVMSSMNTKSRASSNLPPTVKAPQTTNVPVPSLNKLFQSLKNSNPTLNNHWPTLNKTKLLLLGNSLDGI